MKSLINLNCSLARDLGLNLLSVLFFHNFSILFSWKWKAFCLFFVQIYYPFCKVGKLIFYKAFVTFICFVGGPKRRSGICQKFSFVIVTRSKKLFMTCSTWGLPNGKKQRNRNALNYLCCIIQGSKHINLLMAHTFQTFLNYLLILLVFIHLKSKLL